MGRKKRKRAPPPGSGGGGRRKGRKYSGGGGGGGGRGGIFVVGQDDFALNFSDQVLQQGGPQQLGPYKSTHNILVIGDGDLTFSLSLASALGGSKIVATTFDSLSVLRKKYQGVYATIAALEAVGATVLHNVDATSMDERLGRDYHRIVFNFPHVGGATEEDVKLNQELLRGYFAQSLGRLAATGECHVPLRRTLFYDSWDIVAQAERAGMRLSRVEKFEGDYLSYENQRTSGEGQMRQAPSIENARRYVFVRDKTARKSPPASASGQKTTFQKKKGLVRAKKMRKKKKMRFGSGAALSLLFLLFSVLGLGSSLPSPPKVLATSFSAFQTIRSASPFGPVYSNGSVFADTKRGAFRSNISDYLNADGAWSDYLRICPQAFHTICQKAGIARRIPLA